MRWLRLYSEILHDRKVQTLSDGDFRGWIGVLCLASEGSPRGTLPPLEDIGFALRITDEDAAGLLERLTRAGLLDPDADGILRVHAWESRQFESDGSTARVQRHRARQQSDSGDETFPKRYRNTAETGSRRFSNAPRDRTDSDSKSERAEQNSSPSRLDDIDHGPRRPTPILTNFQPTPETRDVGRRRGMNDRQIDDAITKLVNYSQGKGRLEVDWQAHARTWLLNERIGRDADATSQSNDRYNVVSGLAGSAISQGLARVAVAYEQEHGCRLSRRDVAYERWAESRDAERREHGQPRMADDPELDPPAPPPTPFPWESPEEFVERTADAAR